MKTEDVWDFIFKEQLEKSKLISKEMISELKSTPLFGKYKEGEKILFFIDEIINYEDNEINIKMNLTQFAYPSGFNEFINLYTFVRMDSLFPVCKKI